jgi:hypothetical protein
MQIIEVTDLAVRSAVIRLRRTGTPLQFVLYPMIHMAKPAFYAAVTKRLEQADVVVVEGVGGGKRKRSLLAGALTLSYTALKFNRRAQLVEQDIDYRALGVPIVHPDVSVEEFTNDWRRVPITDRAMMWLVLPAVVLARLFGGSRVVWSKSMETNDLPLTNKEEELNDLPPELEAAFAGQRDERLVAALCRLHEERGHEELEVAVVYGAGHTAAIVAGLQKRYGYRPRSADWLTIADL